MGGLGGPACMCWALGVPRFQPMGPTTHAAGLGRNPGWAVGLQKGPLAVWQKVGLPTLLKLENLIVGHGDSVVVGPKGHDFEKKVCMLEASWPAAHIVSLP